MDASVRNRVLWHSRRGMLELDILLEPFARNRFESLTPVQQRLFQEFLQHEDQELFGWLMLREAPPRKSYREIIRLILENARHPD